MDLNATNDVILCVETIKEPYTLDVYTQATVLTEDDTFGDELETLDFKLYTELTETEVELDIKNEKVVTYKCGICTYQTKYHYDLKRHMLTHKDASEVEMHKCSACTYETKYNQNLKRHMLKHGIVTSDVEMYKCGMCSFTTTYTNVLKRHVLKHKDASEVEMYRCPICSFETKYKCSLKNHVLTHNYSPNVGMFRCALCGYGTRYKNCLIKHMVRHRDALEDEKRRAEQEI